MKQDDDIDDAIAGAKARVRLTEPIAKHSVFRDTVEDAVRPHDGSIDRTGKNECPDDDDEAMKDQTHQKRTFQIHGQATDQVLEETLTYVVRNDHDGKERNQGSKYQAVNEDDQTGFLQVPELGRLHFAVDLRQ